MGHRYELHVCQFDPLWRVTARDNGRRMPQHCRDYPSLDEALAFARDCALQLLRKNGEHTRVLLTGGGGEPTLLWSTAGDAASGAPPQPTPDLPHPGTLPAAVPASAAETCSGGIGPKALPAHQAGSFSRAPMRCYEVRQIKDSGDWELSRLASARMPTEVVATFASQDAAVANAERICSWIAEQGFSCTLAVYQREGATLRTFDAARAVFPGIR